MRTHLSEKQVAIMGRSGWAAVNHAREYEEGVMVDIRFSMLNPGRADLVTSLKLKLSAYDKHPQHFGSICTSVAAGTVIGVYKRYLLRRQARRQASVQILRRQQGYILIMGRSFHFLYVARNLSVFSLFLPP